MYVQPTMKDHKEPSEQALKVQAEIGRFLNSYSEKGDDFCLAMDREHRTLQQAFTKLCLQWIEHCSKDEYRTDDRNKASQETSKLLMELFREHLSKVYTGPTLDIMAKPSNHLPTI